MAGSFSGGVHFILVAWVHAASPVRRLPRSVMRGYSYAPTGWTMSAPGGGTLCGLVVEGVLAKEATAFLQSMYPSIHLNSADVGASIQKTWLASCAKGTDNDVDDVSVVNAIRQTMCSYPGLAARPKSSLQEVGGNCDKEATVFTALGLNSSGRILDYGSGPGDMLRGMKKCSLGSKNVGVDVQDVRSSEVLAGNVFQFIQLQAPYPESFAAAIDKHGLEGSFERVEVRVVFHHIGNEKEMRATVKQLGRVVKPCGALLLADWDNDPNAGRPDLSPLFDLVHTWPQTLGLDGKACSRDITQKDLHQMWEGSSTIYLSRKKYQQIVEEETGLTLQHDKDLGGNVFHSFQQVFRKGSDCGVAKDSYTPVFLEKDSL